jgi:hypothetical protein
MHTEDFLINDGSNWEAVETISEGLPQLDVIPSLALIVESIDSVDGGALVVSSEEEEVLRVLDLISEEETDCFQALFASIDIITKEEIIGIGWEATVLKESE